MPLPTSSRRPLTALNLSQLLQCGLALTALSLTACSVAESAEEPSQTADENESEQEEASEEEEQSRQSEEASSDSDTEPGVGVVPDLDDVSPTAEDTEAESASESSSDAEGEIVFGGGSSTVSVEVENSESDTEGSETEEAEPAVSQIVACESAVGTGDDPIIDDFEDEDFDTLEQDGRAGGWYAYDSAETDDALFEVTETDTPNESTMALHTSGGGFEWSGIGFGLRWGMTNDAGEWLECMYDASIYEGVRFWGRGIAEEVWLSASVPEEIPIEDGGQCETGCWNNYGVNLEFTEEWQEYFIPFSDFVQGETDATLDPSTIRTMQFEMGYQTEYDIWLDDMGFYLPEQAPSAEIE